MIHSLTRGKVKSVFAKSVLVLYHQYTGVPKRSKQLCNLINCFYRFRLLHYFSFCSGTFKFCPNAIAV